MLTVKQTLISIYKQLSIFSIDELTFPIKSYQYTDIFYSKFVIFSKICLHLAIETKFIYKNRKLFLKDLRHTYLIYNQQYYNPNNQNITNTLLTL